MRLLLDTHAALWWWTDDARLGTRARRAIGKDSSEVFVSAASVWELAIKAQLGRLPSIAARLPEIPALIGASGFFPMAIEPLHALRAPHLLPGHRDPFDRMLAAQAEVEGLTLVTNDAALTGVVGTLW